MSDSTAKRWLAIYGIGFVLLTVGLTLIKHGPSWIELLSQQPSQNTTDGESACNEYAKADERLNSTQDRFCRDQGLPSISNNGDTPITDPAEQAKTQHEKDDLKAQQDMAWWAMLMFGATAVAVVVTGAGVWYVRDTLHVTRNLHTEANRTSNAALEATKAAIVSNQQQKEAFFAQQRAWLHLDIDASTFESDFKWGGEEGSVDVKLRFRNLGATPTYYALLKIAVRVDSHGINEVRKSMVDDAMNESFMETGFNVIPKADLPWPFAIHVKRSEIESSLAERARVGIERRHVTVSIFLIGCVRYHVAYGDSGDRRKTTSFILSIERTRDNKWMSADIHPDLGDVPKESLRFERWPVGDVFPT